MAIAFPVDATELSILADVTASSAILDDVTASSTILDDVTVSSAKVAPTDIRLEFFLAIFDHLDLD